MVYGRNNDDVIDDVTWPWKVKVVIPKSLRPVISKTARVRDLVTMGHLNEMESAVSNGHLTDHVTDPEQLTSWPSYYLRRRRRLCFRCCLFVCPSDYSQTCEWILTKFFGGVGHGSRTKWYNFGGDLDRASDPGVQSPKSGCSGSAEVCSLWVHSCF